MTNSPDNPQPMGLIDVLQRIRIPLSLAVVTCLIVRLVVLRLCYQYQPHDPLNWHDPAGLVGDSLIVIGLGIRSWAAMVIRKLEELAQTGPYSFCRHPLYLGSLLMLIGFLTLIGDTFTTVTLLGMVVVLYSAAIRKEEGWLAAKFGAVWDEYRRSTPLLLPLRWTGPLGPLSLQSWLKNREYQAIVACALGVAAVKLGPLFL